MDTNTGEFYIDAATRAKMTDKYVESLDNIKLTILNSMKEMPKEGVPINNLPNPDCLLCGGTGHSLRVLKTLKYYPCSCVLGAVE